MSIKWLENKTSMIIEYLLVYLSALNLITFILFGIDKFAAIKGRTRIRVATLLVFAFIGGAFGGLLAMYLFRHKTRKLKFKVGIPIMLVLQISVILYILKTF